MRAHNPRRTGRGQHAAQPLLRDDDVTVGGRGPAVDPRPGRYASRSPSETRGAVLGHFEDQHRPGAQRRREARAGAARAGPGASARRCRAPRAARSIACGRAGRGRRRAPTRRAGRSTDGQQCMNTTPSVDCRALVTRAPVIAHLLAARTDPPSPTSRPRAVVCAWLIVTHETDVAPADSPNARLAASSLAEREAHTELRTDD